MAPKKPTSACHSTPGIPGSGASRSVTSAGWTRRVSPPTFNGVCWSLSGVTPICRATPGAARTRSAPESTSANRVASSSTSGPTSVMLTTGRYTMRPVGCMGPLVTSSTYGKIHGKGCGLVTPSSYPRPTSSARRSCSVGARSTLALWIRLDRSRLKRASGVSAAATTWPPLIATHFPSNPRSSSDRCRGSMCPQTPPNAPTVTSTSCRQYVPPRG
jgi:hypothetical protein